MNKANSKKLTNFFDPFPATQDQFFRREICRRLGLRGVPMLPMCHRELLLWCHDIIGALTVGQLSASSPLSKSVAFNTTRRLAIFCAHFKFARGYFLEYHRRQLLSAITLFSRVCSSLPCPSIAELPRPRQDA